MKLTSPSQVRALLEQEGVQPHEALGQSFLIDANIRDFIVALVDPGPGDVVLEVGPGLGVMTEALAARAGRLVAVEKDAKLCGLLRRRFGASPSVGLVHADFLTLGPDWLASQKVTKLASNLPYSVGSRILMELFALPDPLPQVTVMVQLEVGERLVADAGEPERGLLGVWAQRVYAPHIRKIVSPSCFYPPPKVRSAVVQLERLPPAERRADRTALFGPLTKAAFGFRRKQMGTILNRIAAGLGVDPRLGAAALDDLGMDARLRPEALTIAQWLDLAEALGRRSGAAGLKTDDGMGTPR